MLFTSRRRSTPQTTLNPLIPVVLPLDHGTRRALYAAANGGTLKRGTWDGCAFNRAAEAIGRSAASQSEVAGVFDVPPRLIADFVRCWDRLRGDDRRCTDLLRDAILAVGLFADQAPAGRSAEQIEVVEKTRAELLAESPGG